MAGRLSLLFSFTTQALNPGVSVAHSGGWSESHWANASGNITLTSIRQLANYRANLLSTSCAITGYRVQDYTLAGNKLIPNQSSTGRILFPGTSAESINMPQDGLSLYLSTVDGPNVSRQVIRGLADSYIQAGEFTPVSGFLTRIQTYFTELTGSGWKFIGRNRSMPNARVNRIDAGVVTLAGPIGGAANSSYIRLNRVRDDNGNPVIGTFLITAIAGNNYTVPGLAGVMVTTPSGTARIDELKIFPYSAGAIGRAVVRKVGRPFEQYRGRASKRRKR